MERVVPVEQVDTLAPVPDELLRFRQALFIDKGLRHGNHAGVNVDVMPCLIAQRLVGLVVWRLVVQRQRRIPL